AKSPRYASLGIVGLIAYMIGLVTRQPPETLPVRLVVLLIAAGDAALIRLVLLPERPQAELKRLRRALHGVIDRVLRQIAAAIEAGGWTRQARAELRRTVYRVGEIVMLAQARVTAGQGGRWLQLLAIELATERTARVALQNVGTPADRPALLARLRALLDRVEPPAIHSTTPLTGALGLLDHALHEAASVALTPATAPPVVAAPGLRPPVQTAIAAALAIISGELVSPNRWYWAAFAAYVMFQGTRSRGESVAKGVQFMIGTASGAIVGALAGTLLSGHDMITLAAIVLAVFLAFQANLAGFGVMVFWITIILGLMFGLLGYFPPDLLLLRLKETAAGAACGAVVASVVLVRREYAATRDATVAFLRALGLSADSAARVLLDGQPAPQLTANILSAEQRFRELEAIARSEQSTHPLTRNEALHRRLLLLEGCEQWARELGHICLQGVALDDPALALTARQTLARIDATLSSLIDSLGSRSLAASSTAEPEPELGQAVADDPAHRAVRLLLRVDSALLRLGGGQ
ncbi:MAG TPA: FUSC family protein, partial [Acetobacteraceae bacterium]